jgi:hypothetical protein
LAELAPQKQIVYGTRRNCDQCVLLAVVRDRAS